MFMSCLPSGNNVRGCVVCFALICVVLFSLLQMRQTKTLNNRSTISCPGNKAVSSSGSECTYFYPSRTNLNIETGIKNELDVHRSLAFCMADVTCIRHNGVSEHGDLLSQQCCGPKIMWRRGPSHGQQESLPYFPFFFFTCSPLALANVSLLSSSSSVSLCK